MNRFKLKQVQTAIHEGFILKTFIEEERGRLNEVVAAIGVERTGIYRLYGESKISEAIKSKLTKAKINIQGLNVPQLDNGNKNSSTNQEGNAFNLIPPDADIAEARKVFDKLAPLVSRYVETLLARTNDLEERVKLLQELNDLKDEKIRRLEQL